MSPPRPHGICFDSPNSKFTPTHHLCQHLSQKSRQPPLDTHSSTDTHSTHHFPFKLAITTQNSPLPSTSFKTNLHLFCCTSHRIRSAAAPRSAPWSSRAPPL